jgi:hypothetical protein
MPTVLDLLDIPVPAGAEGVSVVPLIVGTGGPTQAHSTALPPGIAFSEALLYGEEQKSLSVHPWKLVYNVVTEDMALYNLAQDPGEHENLYGQVAPPEAVLDETLFKFLFSISDTWFVEMAGGGEPHRFDLSIEARDKRGPAALSIHRFIDAEGNIHPAHSLGDADIKPSRIDVRNLSIRDPLILAVKTEKRKASVVFDIRIDGKPATDCTFVGASLSHPISMPFTEQPSGHSAAGRVRAADKPTPPYCLIWLDRSSHEEEAAIELDDDTRRDLRSLGYIQ